MENKKDTDICPPQFKAMMENVINRLNADCTALLGRNFGISRPRYKMATIQEFITKDSGRFFLVRGELEDSYEGDINIIFQINDAVKIGGSLLGAQEGEIKEEMKKESLSEDYVDGLTEFGNQFCGLIATAFRHKLPKPVNVKFSMCSILNMENLKELFPELADDYVHLSSLLLIKGFESGQFNMFIPAIVVEDFFDEQLHEKTTNVLVLDDNASDIRNVQRCLSNTEFRVLPANNSAEAIILLNKEKVNLILLDVHMPDGSGIEICKQIKKAPFTKGIPIVMVSRRPTKESVVEALESGARDFLVKPVGKEMLMKRIDRYKHKKKEVSLF